MVANFFWRIQFALCIAFFFTQMNQAGAQSVVVMVNDDPITSYDVAQRQRFLALTSGFGQRMKQRLQSDKTKEQFQAYMREHRPQSKDEAEALQKKFVANIQQEVLSNASSSARQEAIDQLIDERLMLQAAKDQKIDITEAEVNEALTQMAKRGSDGKASLDDFLGQFKSQGVNPVTLKQRIKAQNAWREVIRRVYGSRVRAAVSPATTSSTDDGDVTVDVKLVRLGLPASADQKVVAGRLIEAETLLKNFSSCDKLAGDVKKIKNASVKDIKNEKLANFRGDVRAALLRAEAGQMTPAVIGSGAVELHALCGKKTAVASGSSGKQGGQRDVVQEEFQLYSRRHLKDMRDRANLKYYNKKG